VVFEQTTFIDGDKKEQRWILLTGAREDRSGDLVERVRGKPWGNEKLIEELGKIITPPAAASAQSTSPPSVTTAAGAATLPPNPSPSPLSTLPPPPPLPPVLAAEVAEAALPILPVETLVVDLQKGVINLGKFPVDGTKKEGDALLVGKVDKALLNDWPNTKQVIIGGEVNNIAFLGEASQVRVIVADGAVGETQNLWTDSEVSFDYCQTPVAKVELKGKTTVAIEKTGADFNLKLSDQAIAGVDTDCLKTIPKERINQLEKVYEYKLPLCDDSIVPDKVEQLATLRRTADGKIDTKDSSALHYAVEVDGNKRHFALVTGENKQTLKKALFVFERMTIIDREGKSTMRWVLVDGREQGDHTLEQRIKDKTGIETEKLIGLNEEVRKRLNEIQAEYQERIKAEGEPFSESEKQGVKALIEATNKYYIMAGESAQKVLNSKIGPILNGINPGWQKDISVTVTNAVANGNMTRRQVEKLLEVFATSDDKTPCVVALRPRFSGAAIAVEISATEKKAIVNDFWLSTVNGDMSNLSLLVEMKRKKENLVIIGDKCGQIQKCDGVEIGFSPQRQFAGNPINQLTPTTIHLGHDITITELASVPNVGKLEGNNHIQGQLGRLLDLENSDFEVGPKGRVIIGKGSENVRVDIEKNGRVFALSEVDFSKVKQVGEGLMGQVSNFDNSSFKAYFRSKKDVPVIQLNQSVVLPNGTPATFSLNNIRYDIFNCKVRAANNKWKDGYSLIRVDSVNAIYLEDIWTEADKKVKVGGKEMRFCTQEQFDRENTPEQKEINKTVEIIKKQMADWLFDENTKPPRNILTDRSSSIKTALIQSGLLGENETMNRAWFLKDKSDSTKGRTDKDALEKIFDYCLPLDSYGKVLHSVNFGYDSAQKKPVVTITVSGNGSYRENYESVDLVPFIPPKGENWSLRLIGKEQNCLHVKSQKEVNIDYAENVDIRHYSKVSRINTIQGQICVTDGSNVDEIIKANEKTFLFCNDSRINYLGPGCSGSRLQVRGANSTVIADFPIFNGDFDYNHGSILSFGMAPTTQEKTLWQQPNSLRGQEFIMYWDTTNYDDFTEMLHAKLYDGIVPSTSDTAINLPDRPGLPAGFMTSDGKLHCIVKLQSASDITSNTENYAVFHVSKKPDGKNLLILEQTVYWKRNEKNNKIDIRLQDNKSQIIDVKYSPVRYGGAMVLPVEENRKDHKEEVWKEAHAVKDVMGITKIRSKNQTHFISEHKSTWFIELVGAAENNRLIMPESSGGSVTVKGNNILSIGKLGSHQTKDDVGDNIIVNDQAHAFVGYAIGTKTEVELQSIDARVVVSQKALENHLSIQHSVGIRGDVLDQVLVIDTMPDNNPKDIIVVRDGDLDRNFKIKWARKNNGDRAMCVFEQVMEVQTNGSPVYHWAMVDVDAEEKGSDEFINKILRTTGLEMDDHSEIPKVHLTTNVSFISTIAEQLSIEGRCREAVDSVMAEIKNVKPNHQAVIRRWFANKINNGLFPAIGNEKLAEMAQQATLKFKVLTALKRGMFTNGDSVTRYERVFDLLWPNQRDSKPQTGVDEDKRRINDHIAANIAAILKDRISPKLGEDIPDDVKDEIKLYEKLIRELPVK